jgi:hypothetical protein
VAVYFVYKALAHPEGGTNNYVTPFTLEERLLHVKEAERTLGATIPWLCDTMDNDLKHALGDRPNSEFIIDPDGKLVRMRDWSSPATLRADLEELVGKVKNPTRVSDLDLKIETTPKPAAKGVVKRVSLPGQGQPLLVEPKESKTPYYVKLRAEADGDLLRSGNGKLYLGFHLDPIYHVHWNNLAKPLSFTIAEAKGIKVTPETGTGPKVEQESDIDPREFIVDVDSEKSADTFELTVKYFACNDEEGFCIPVTQTYVVNLKQDRDGGQAQRSGSRGGSGGSSQSGSGRPGERSPQGGRSPGGFSVERLMGYDKNKDGKVSRNEMPAQMRRMLDRADSNGDDAIDEKEAKAIESRFRGRSPQRRPR